MQPIFLLSYSALSRGECARDGVILGWVDYEKD